MKKLMCVLILLAFVGSTLIMTGCLGGSGGGILAAIVFTIAITAATGGSGAAVFAANNRISLRPAISIEAQNVNMKVFPMDASGQKVGVGQAIPKEKITVNVNGEVSSNVEIDASAGYNQYSIEIFSNDTLILKAIKYIPNAQKTGTVAVNANPESTAKAFMYEKWNSSASTRTYSDFEFNLAKTLPAPNVNGITTEVKNRMETFAGNANALPNYTSLLNAGGAVEIEAAKVSNNVPAMIVTGTDSVYRMHPLEFDASPVFLNVSWGTGNRPAFFGLQNSPTVNPWRLGNQQHFYYDEQNPKSDEILVAYAGDGVDLSGANAATPTIWYTNSYAAKGNRDIAIGDVYYFRIKSNDLWYYGAIKVNSLPQTSDISEYVAMSYAFKYNRDPNNTSLQ